MTAHIKIEVEGSGAEVREALEELLGPLQVTAEEPLQVITTSTSSWAEPEIIVDAEKLDEMEEINKRVRSGDLKPLGAEKFCMHCGKELTSQQIKAKGKYCSLKCANLHKPKKPIVPKEPKTLSEKVKAITGRTCLECGKELTKGQVKFCSKTHSNRYHLRERQEARKASEKESHSPRS